MEASFYRNRAYDRMEAGDYLGAVEDFTLALQVKKKHALTWYYRGLCNCYMENDLAALNDFSQALRIRPNMSDAWCELSRVMYMFDDYPRALEYCTKAIKINRHHTDALALRGYMYLNMGQPQKALSDLNRAVGHEPFDAHARTYRALTFQKLQRWEDALEDHDISLFVEESALGYLNRAVVKMHLMDYDSALIDARKAHELDPEWGEVWDVIGEIEEML